MKLDSKDTLGILGGLGPMATTHFMERIISMTATESDQGHIRMAVLNYPDIPDRTAHILNHEAPDPLPYLINAARQLEEMGSREIAIPCVTAQYYHKRLQHEISIPIMNGVVETTEYLCSIGVEKVGILATSGTVRSNIFGQMLESKGIGYVYPDEICQKLIMSIIYDQVKAGRNPDVEGLSEVGSGLIGKGAQKILLGCTELSVIKDDYAFPGYFLDVLDIMARCCVVHFARLREEYNRL